MSTSKIKPNDLDESLLDLINKPSVSSWNDLTDKPFGEETKEVETEELFCSYYNDNWHQENTINFVSSVIDANYDIILGELYTVVFNDITFPNCECVLNEYQGIELPSLLVKVDESISLTISYCNKELAITTGLSTNAFYLAFILDKTITDTNYNYEASISVLGTSKETVSDIKHLDPKFIKDMYYEENGTLTEIFPETILVDGIGDEDGDNINETGVMYLLSPLVANEAYVVNWNGTQYECVAQDVSSLIGAPAGSVIFIGDGSSAGLLSNGEPFTIMYAPMIFDVDDDGEVYINTMFIFTDGGLYPYPTLSISQYKKVVHQIDPKYLPLKFINSVSEVFSGSIASLESEMDSYFLNPLPFEIVAGETYIVNWCGTEYECIAESQTKDDITVNVLGNTGMITGIDNGVPFLFIFLVAPVIFDGITLYGMIHPLDDKAELPFTYSIIEKSSLMLDPEYIKDMYYEKKRVEKLVNYTGTLGFDSQDLCIKAIPINNSIEIGNSYTVIFNGVEYSNCVAIHTDDLEPPLSSSRDTSCILINV